MTRLLAIAQAVVVFWLIAPCRLLAGSGPAIVTPPQSQGVEVGSNAVFNVVATGQAPLSYQWSFNLTNLTNSAHISGATSATLTVSNVAIGDAGNYQVTVSNSHGNVTTNATLTIPPSIVAKPAAQSILLGGNVTFSAVATGEAPIAWRWYFNGAPLTDGGRVSGSLTPSLTISDVQLTDAGGYSVTVTNPYGSATSQTASLTTVPVTHYVSLTSLNPTPPFTDWSTAATNIQNAIDAATPGDLISVSNGVYQTGGEIVYGAMTNRVAINKAVTVQSVNGPLVTTIQGNPAVIEGPDYIGSNAVRCVYLATNAVLSGFTLADGATCSLGDTNKEESGGGAWCEDTSAILTNCVISGNFAYLSGGGVFKGTLDNCVVSNNASSFITSLSITNSWGSGGGAYGTTLSNSLVTGNYSLLGGGVDQGTLFQCIISNNVATELGGNFSQFGGALADSTAYNCKILNNQGFGDAGGTWICNLYNCLISGNSDYASVYGYLYNCTIANNSYGVFGCGLFNCISYFNTNQNYSGSTFYNSCTTPMPAGGTNNITNDPMFVAPYEFHLQSGSPCIDTGNNGYYYAPTDLDGNPRIVNGTVDMGCYEYQYLPLFMIAQPSDQTNTIGQTVSFTVLATGSPPLNYQWLFDGADIPGATDATLTLTNIQLTQIGTYSVILSNALAFSVSSNATLTVDYPPPVLLSQPTNLIIVAGSTASFSAAVLTYSPTTYQWVSNGVPLVDNGRITGSATTNLVISNTQPSDASSYQLIAANDYGSVTSVVATLTLNFPPSNISVPGIQYVAVGNTAYFTVTASGNSPFNFQWQRDGTNINNGGRYTEANVTAWSGATFDIANVNTGDSDTYYVVVTNQYGQATSGPVVLSVGYPPLSLDVQPINQTVKLGGTATFDAFIGGTPPFTFHWQLNGADIPADNRVSSTNETLVISPVEASDAGTYTITHVTNPYGGLIASGFNGYLTVLLPPAITAPPQDQSVPAGTNATFSVSATSANGSISYQWYFNGTTIPWAQAASMTLTNVQDTNTGSYYVLLSNQGGSVTSSVVQLTVEPSAPWFVNPLQSQNASIGQNVTLDPGARGSAPLSFQWLLNGTNLPGAASPTLNFPSAQTNNTGVYFVIVTNNYGSSTSAVATLIVQNPVKIIGQPLSQDALLGTNMNFTVTASGTALNYQWYFNGVPLADGGRISGSTTATLNIANVQSADAGGYFVAISNLLSSATSLTASLIPQAVLGPSVRYVMLGNTTPLSPYLNWNTAATNIQDAVDAAVPGDSVVVSNGLYNYGGRLFYGTNTTNRVVINKPITVQSLNGPAMTTIAGFNTNPQIYHAGRCVYLTNGALLSGFTLTEGGASPRLGDLVHEQSGGGAWCEGPGAVISNCVISANAANYGYGGGVFGGTVINSLLATNTGSGGAGAASNILLNCTIQKNIGEGEATLYGSADGGGAFGSTLSNCVLVANSASAGGGASGGVLFYCLLTNNTASSGGGAYSNVLYNCILVNNLAREFGGGAYNSILYNCTVVSNSATAAGGPGGGGVDGCAATNSIIYYNTTGGDVLNSKAIAYCCSPSLSGFAGCIINPPLFVNLSGGDFHLLSNSPCINSGNNAGVTVSTDFDGHPRIVGGTVDMGAYEYQTPSSVVSYAYLQQYGLPTDGSVDFASLDGAAFDVYEDWIAGLNPTNSTSVLLASPGLFSSGVTVLWPSVSGRTYLVQRSTNLVTQPFTTIQSNIAGHAGTSSYTDTSATNRVPYFYRVGVQR